MNSSIEDHHEELESFCQKWQVRELAVFGSALRDDFRRDSDVDLLVSFAHSANLDIDAWLDMKEELQSILGRTVDLVDKDALRNPWRRHEILATCEVVYAG